MSSDFEGLDATLNLDGVEYTSQIKPIENLSLDMNIKLSYRIKENFTTQEQVKSM